LVSFGLEAQVNVKLLCGLSSELRPALSSLAALQPTPIRFGKGAVCCTHPQQPDSMGANGAPSPRTLLQQLKNDQLGSLQMKDICEKSAASKQHLSPEATTRMAMAITALVARGELNLLDSKTLLRCFHVFRRRATGPTFRVHGLLPLLAFCKVPRCTH
jgi:hypothetical protein